MRPGPVGISPPAEDSEGALRSERAEAVEGGLRVEIGRRGVAGYLDATRGAFWGSLSCGSSGGTTLGFGFTSVATRGT